MPAFCLVDPNFYKTRGRNVLILLASRVCCTQRIDELPVIVTKLAHHLDGGDELVIVVFESLVSRDVADRSDRRAANLARAFGNVVGDSENLAGMFVE